jgi:hypothetical protein
MPHFERLTVEEDKAALLHGSTTGLKLGERWTEPKSVRFKGPPDAIAADPGIIPTLTTTGTATVTAKRNATATATATYPVFILYP